MKTVKEVSKMSGVTVRTLHYYDEIGLLKPTSIHPNGYRLYDDKALAKLQEILFFKELDFPLKEIDAILNNPYYHRKAVLQNHITFLEMKKERLNKLIHLARAVLKGEKMTNFQAFANEEIKKEQKKYAQEAKERWGQTAAYQESEAKAKHYTTADWQIIQEEINDIMRDFAQLRDTDPAATAAQELVQIWKNHLNKFHYEADNEILSALGQMYVDDERFTASIDQFGEGTADFMSRAIAIYVKE